MATTADINRAQVQREARAASLVAQGMLPIWEYKVVDGNLGNNGKTEKIMNELGTQGWELVAVLATPPQIGIASVLHFRRQIR